MDEKSRSLNDPDREYTARCKKGDINAFEMLVEKHQKQMINIAYRLTGDYDEACEIVQEAFLSAYRNIDKFRGDAKFSTWLAGITVNGAKDHLRRMKNRACHEILSIDDASQEELPLLCTLAASENSALEQLERVEIQRSVQRCIDELDRERREVLVLRDIEEFSYDEIAEALHIADGTVKSRLFRARDALKECLKKVLEYI